MGQKEPNSKPSSSLAGVMVEGRAGFHGVGGPVADVLAPNDAVLGVKDQASRRLAPEASM
jgi:hypothetical protein